MIDKFKNVFCLGIGGIGVSAISEYLYSMGKNVYGYDREKNELTKNLESKGIKIYYDDYPKIEEQLNPKDTLIIYSSAIKVDNPWLEYFVNDRYCTQKRSSILGEITKDTTCFAIAGTHGKTTTSCMLAHIFIQNNIEITAFLGGISENYNTNFILGNSNVSIVEADEFDKSFLYLTPTYTCITSTDADHLDIYECKNDLEYAYMQFVKRVKSINNLISYQDSCINSIKYGTDPSCEYRATDITFQKVGYQFVFLTPNGESANIFLPMIGVHNVMNSLGALSMAHLYGLPISSIGIHMSTFKGIRRRASLIYKSNKYIFLDDYAHHPTEINAILSSLKEVYGNKKILGIFQPHTYTRTRDFIDDFAVSLSLCDSLILLDIYPAREEPIVGVTSDILFSKIKLESKIRSSLEQVLHRLKEFNFDIIITMGAGDINKLVNPIKNWLNDK